MSVSAASLDPGVFESCIAAGGVVVFPSDTVYGLACDPTNERAVAKLCRLKGRSWHSPSAVMFFTLERALRELRWLDARTKQALARLLPGPVAPVVPNPERRYPLACGDRPWSLGLRVPDLRGELRPAASVDLRPLAAIDLAVLQSSANLSGGPDARRLEDVPREIREGADLVLDGGDLPGTPSTVLDLTKYARDNSYTVLRAGAVSGEEVEKKLAR